RERYTAITLQCGFQPPNAPTIVITEQLTGDSTTEFGAPGQVATAEWHVSEPVLDRLRTLHALCRDAFLALCSQAPEQLRKGPRGGGRDTSTVVEHVAQAEKAYASKLRRDLWPEAYYLRRSAYHFTDHLWEIQDRSALGDS
ncbi:MAG: hypothetical protein ACKOW5_16145, partial [Actinomycetales bacterium]